MSFDGLERRDEARRPTFGTDRRTGGWLAHLKDVWPTYMAIVLVLGAIAKLAGLPARVEAVERTQGEHNTMLRYVVCTMGATGRGYDPAACESHLTPDLIGYLRPNVTP